MSEEPSGGGEQPERPYEVGYGKPPVTGQFKPGRSGNPRGRPRRKKPDYRAHAGVSWLPELLLDEAYREVTIRENGKSIRLPAIQAALRSTVIAATKGSRVHMKLLTDIIGETERELSGLRQSLLVAVLDGKAWWKQQCEEAAAAGRPPPEPPIPHPDDVVIDPNFGTVEFRGPMTDDQKREWDKALAHRDMLINALRSFDKQNGFGPWDEDSERDLCAIRQQIQAVNDVLPKRYQRTLFYAGPQP